MAARWPLRVVLFLFFTYSVSAGKKHFYLGGVLFASRGSRRLRLLKGKTGLFLWGLYGSCTFSGAARKKALHKA